MSNSFLRLLLFLLLFVPCWAQEYYFHNYTGDDGLSQLAGQVLFQDKDGYIWIGTQAGLNCYDGNIFEIFSVRNGLVNDWVNAITQDATGKLWIGTNGGLSPEGHELLTGSGQICGQSIHRKTCELFHGCRGKITHEIPKTKKRRERHRAGSSRVL